MPWQRSWRDGRRVLGAQVAGTRPGIALAIAGGAVAYGGLKAAVGLRLDPEQEFNGADLAIHRISTSPERELAW